MGRETSRIELGTAVVPLQSRHPVALGQQALSVQAVCRGRFSLGIGLSHQIVIEGMLGLSFAKPYSHMREYLAVLGPLVRQGQVSFAGDEFRVNANMAVPGASTCPILVAALAPKMLALAGRETDGTITWMTGPKTLREHTVPRICEAAAAAGRPPPRVVIGLPVAVTTHPMPPEHLPRAASGLRQPALLSRHARSRGLGACDVASWATGAVRGATTSRKTAEDLSRPGPMRATDAVPERGPWSGPAALSADQAPAESIGPSIVAVVGRAVAVSLTPEDVRMRFDPWWPSHFFPLGPPVLAADFLPAAKSLKDGDPSKRRVTFKPLRGDLGTGPERRRDAARAGGPGEGDSGLITSGPTGGEPAGQGFRYSTRPVGRRRRVHPALGGRGRRGVKEVGGAPTGLTDCDAPEVVTVTLTIAEAKLRAQFSAPKTNRSVTGQRAARRLPVGPSTALRGDPDVIFATTAADQHAAAASEAPRVGRLNLSPDVAFENLVNVFREGQMDRVRPARRRTTASSIGSRREDEGLEPGCGHAMPSGLPAISADEFEALRLWIQFSAQRKACRGNRSVA
jgi:alkanesulfonate monooxygenase SsuD/methylene tetrahydromethanopterin reductase-like flavin-dependent oxidoreductase (luciferase family)